MDAEKILGSGEHADSVAPSAISRQRCMGRIMGLSQDFETQKMFLLSFVQNCIKFLQNEGETVSDKVTINPKRTEKFSPTKNNIMLQ